jgi:MFS family permease
MLYPITPIFLTTVLGASMASLGLIEGCAEAIASLLKTYSGSWSDKLEKRKPFIIVGYALGAISKPFIGVSTNWSHVLFARLLDRTGKGIRSAPRDALIADSVIPENRGAAFGWHRSMDTLGAAIGPLFAILLLSFDAKDLRSLYFWALIPGLLSVLVLFFIKEKKHEPKKIALIINPFKSWNLLSPEFKKFVYAWGLFSLTNSSDVFLLMKAKSSGLTLTSVILLYCAFNLVYSLSSPYLGKLSDQIPRRKLLIAGLLIFILVYLGFSQATDAWQFWVLFLSYGLYMGATEGVGKALAVDLGSERLKGTSLGILGTVTGVATIFASAIAGQVWDVFGPQYTFFYGVVGAVLSIAVLGQISELKPTFAKP